MSSSAAVGRATTDVAGYGPRMTTVCITGSTDGIGRAAAEALVRDGHRVLVHARSAERGEPVVDALSRGGGDVDLVVGDLSDEAQVRDLAAQVRQAAPGTLGALVHNAAVWRRGGTPRTTAAGRGTTTQVNVLAPHLLTALLADELRAAAPSRLVWLGSGMARRGRPDPDRLDVDTSDDGQAYADSKAACCALATGWAGRLAEHEVTSVAVDPGWVVTKLASRGAPGTPEQGARTVVHAAVDPSVAGRHGSCWKNCRETAMPPAAQDEDLVERLLRAADGLVAAR